MQFGFPALPSGFTAVLLLFTAPLKDAGTCTVPGPNQEDLSTVLQPQRGAAAGWGREGEERKGGHVSSERQKSFFTAAICNPPRSYRGCPLKPC